MDKVIVFLLSSVALCLAWHEPVHSQITQAALRSLPAPMQRQWEEQASRLVQQYCLYPDYYTDPSPAVRAPLRRYCEQEGHLIHNVTWNRGEDLRSLEYVLNGISQNLRAGDPESAAKFAGVLAHFLEDSTCSGHALIPMDDPLEIMRDLLPPPPHKVNVRLHPIIERSCPKFTLGSRPPRQAGASASEAAASLLDRVYATIRENRANLLELVRAVYRSDEATMDRFRLNDGIKGANLLADAYYTAFLLADSAR